MYVMMVTMMIWIVYSVAVFVCIVDVSVVCSATGASR